MKQFLSEPLYKRNAMFYHWFEPLL